MRRVLMVVIALALFGGAARADVLYSYNGSSYLAGTYFSVQSSTFLPYDITAIPVSSGELVAGGTDLGALTRVYFTNSTTITAYSQPGNAFIGIPLTYNVSQYGTYTGAFGTLVVSNVGGNTVTPEPGSLALLGTGVLGVIGVARRRWA